MKNRISAFGAVIILACVLAASLPARTRAGDAPGLTNADVIAFVQAGVAPQLILDRIRSGVNAFDMSTGNAIALKENGVPDEIIAAMLVAAGGGNNAAMGLPALSPLPTLNAASANAAMPSPAAMQTQAGFSPPLPSANQMGAGAGARFSNELANIADGPPEARRAAVLWMLANKSTVLVPLRDAMRTAANPDMQAAAIHALGGLDDRESIPAIRRLVLSPSPAVRRNAAEALVAMNDTDAVLAAEKSLAQSVAPQDGFIRILGYARPVRAAGELSRILGSGAVALDRAAAAWALAQIGPPAGSAFPVAEAALAGDSDPDVRREAARAVAAFHNPASGRLLQDACKRDPEVRRVTLEAMAEYPEATDFLAGVMTLGTDQIAADELEAARRSLHTLTGQDFGLDGAAWTTWIAQNGGAGGGPAAASSVSSTGMPPPPAPPAPSAPQSDMVGMVPEYSASTPSTPRQGDVDVAQWGIVVDSSAIPMVPEVDGAGAANAPAGLAGLEGLLNRQARQYDQSRQYSPRPGGAPAFGAAGGEYPAALSASDFGVDAPGAALPPPPTTSSTWAGAGASAPAPAFPATLPTMTASAPAPMMTAPAASSASMPPPGNLSGMRLPLPGMSDAGGMQDFSAPPSGDGFSGIYTPGPDPYDVSGYGGSAAYTDELQAEDLTGGTGHLLPEDPSYGDSGYGDSASALTDPNFIPSDMPMEEYAPSDFEGHDSAGGDSGGYGVDDSGMPPPPGGFLSGSGGDSGFDGSSDFADGGDSPFGMTDDTAEMPDAAEEDDGMTLPPFGGGSRGTGGFAGSAGAEDGDDGSYSEDGDFDFDAPYAGDDSPFASSAPNREETPEPAPLPFSREDMEDESAVVSGLVGGRSSASRERVKEEAPPAAAPAGRGRARAGESIIVDDSPEALQKDIERMLDEVPTRILGSDDDEDGDSSASVVVPAPAVRAAPSAPRRAPSRPAKGASVWIPGEDDAVTDDSDDSADSVRVESGAAPGRAAAPEPEEDLIDDTSFEILPAPEGIPSEYVTFDEISDVYTQEGGTTEAAEPEETEEPAESVNSSGTETGTETAVEPEIEPDGEIETDAAEEFDAAGATGATETESGFAPAAPVDSAQVDSVDSPAALPLPLDDILTEAENAAENIVENSAGTFRREADETTSMEALDEVVSDMTDMTGAIEDEGEVLFGATGVNAIVQDEAEAAMSAPPPPVAAPEPVNDQAAPETLDVPPSMPQFAPPPMPSSLPDDFAAEPRDLSGQELPGLPPFDAGLPPFDAGRSQPGDLSLPPLDMPQVSLPEPVSGDGEEGFLPLGTLSLPPSLE